MSKMEFIFPASTEAVKKPARRKIWSNLILSSVFCTLISLLVVIAIIHFTPIAEILITKSSYTLTKNFKELSEYEQLIVSRLANEKTIISVENLWSMQVSFYQTIVSILIALNAAILTIAFLIIRSSSKQEAIKEAIQQIKSYTKSSQFTKLVEKKSIKEIARIQDLYDDNQEVNENFAIQLTGLKQDIETQRELIETIAVRLSFLDTSENTADCHDRTISE